MGQLPLKKKLVMSIFSKYAKTQAKIHNLSYLFWECTLRCNLSCIHCGSDCKKSSSILDMPKEDFLKITNEISKSHNPNKVMIVLTGGEPLLREDIEECGILLRKQGYPWGCVTNGMALTQQKFDNLVKSGLRSITLSIDGLENNHNWMRGSPKSFLNAQKALKIISSDSSIVSDVVTCVNKRNINELEDIRQLLIKNNIKAWRLFTISPIGRAVANPELKIDQNEILQLFNYIKSVRNDDAIETSISCEAYTGIHEGNLRNGFFFCRAGINIASVLADGSISACPNINNSFIQGNIYKNSFMDVWNNNFDEMRNRKWMKRGICEKCKDFKYCNGGAMHMRKDVNSDIGYCLWHEMQKSEKL